MIAEDVNKVVPEVVTVSKDNTIGLSYDKLVALAIEGVKELKKQNEALQAQNKQLEARIKRLEAE